MSLVVWHKEHPNSFVKEFWRDWLVQLRSPAISSTQVSKAPTEFMIFTDFLGDAM